MNFQQNKLNKKNMAKIIIYEAYGFYTELGEFSIDKYEEEVQGTRHLGENEFYTREETEAYVIEQYKGIIQYYQNLIDKLTIK